MVKDSLDFEKYGLKGEELLVSAAVAGLYAMEAARTGSPRSDFKGIVSRIDGGAVTINAPVAKEVIAKAAESLEETLEAWNPEGEMMTEMRSVLLAADIDADRVVQNMSTSLAAFLADISQMEDNPR